MKILIGRDIRRADLVTIEREPVSSIDLMERAACAITEVIAADDLSCCRDCRRNPRGSSLDNSHGSSRRNPHGSSHDNSDGSSRRDQCSKVADYVIFAGRGNNGGDGLAVARLLSEKFGSSRRVSVVTVGYEGELSEDCRTNLERLPDSVHRFVLDKGKVVNSFNGLFNKNTVIIDALLGTGVSGPLREPERGAVRLINSVQSLCRKVISIDLPSGLPTEPGSVHPADFVDADMTVVVEFPKLSLLLPDTGKYAGHLETVHIGLNKDFIKNADSYYEVVDKCLIRSLLKPRNEYDNKGIHGHSLVIAGSVGMMGAALLSTGAALRSGCGLVTARIPAQERAVMYVANPSALVSCDAGPGFSALPDNLSKYSSVAVGPGLGQRQETAAALSALLEFSSGNSSTFARTGAFEPHIKTLVLDADALNIISSKPELLHKIPSGSVLTPHIGELSRLLKAAISSRLIAGGSIGGLYPWQNDMQKVELVRALASRLSSVIVVKGAHTMTCLPDGRCFFNMTGNPGMAKGGSGDILTGLIAGLAARGYNSAAAAILGVWFHGEAGDAAAAQRGVESMNASDILENLRLWQG